MIKINNFVSIDDKDMKFKFIRSSGPGGQNVNKLSSAVELYYNINKSHSLSPEIKLRLISGLKQYINRRGIIVLKSDRYRNQSLNRKDVINKFKSIIKKAVLKRKGRIPTKPSLISINTRLNDKRFVSKLKRSRKITNLD